MSKFEWWQTPWQEPFNGFMEWWGKSLTSKKPGLCEPCYNVCNEVYKFLSGLFGEAEEISTKSWNILWPAIGETLYMSIISTLVAYIIGLMLGIILVVTRKDGIRPMRALNSALGMVVNFMRSIPFLILLAMLFPVTKEVVGKKSGSVAVVFPLIVSAFPYVARIVESSFLEVDPGVLEAAQAMGSTTWQIIRKVLVPEAVPSLLNGFSICMTTILSYTAMASAAAGGGLGSVAITYGLNQQRYDIMYAASIILVVLVIIITVTGTFLNRKTNHKLR